MKAMIKSSYMNFLIKILIIANLCLTYCFAQNNITDTSYFIINNRHFFDDSISYYGMMNEFCVYRIYLNDNTFIENNLLGGDTFQKQKKEWYIKNKNKWNLFFSVDIFFLKKTVKLINSGFFLTPIDTIEFQEKKCYKYRVSLGKNDQTSSYAIFHPNDGIIAILHEDIKIILIRTRKPPYPFMKCTATTRW